MFLKLTSTPKIAPMGKKKTSRRVQKVQNRPKMWPNLKQKVRAVLPKPKLIVYIGRLQNVFEPDPDPKIAPKGQKKSPKSKFKTKS